MSTRNLITKIYDQLIRSPSRICSVQLHKNGDLKFTNETLLSHAENLIHKVREAFPELVSNKTELTLGIVCRNSFEWLVADIACLFGGFTSLPLPFGFNQDQAKHLADFCHGFITDSSGANVLEYKWKIRAPTGRIFFLDTSHKNLNNQLEKISLSPRVDDYVCKVIHTSGTTGTPKGVRQSSHRLSELVHSLETVVADVAYDRYLSIAPLSLLIEQVTAVYLSILKGGTIYFMPADIPLIGEPGANPAQIVDHLYRIKASAVTVPPVIIEYLLAVSRSNNDDLKNYLSTSVHFTGGGAMVKRELLEELSAGNINVYQGYGLSENGSVVSVNTVSDNKFGSVGKPLAHVKIRINKNRGIEIHSSSLFLGYSGLDPSACELTEDGWLCSGDLGYVDSDGHLFITGREKNIICLPNGRNVSPEHVESEFRAYVHIVDAVVFLNHAEELAVLIVAEDAFDKSSFEQWLTDTFSDIEKPKHIHIISHKSKKFSSLFTITGKPIRKDIADTFSQCGRFL